MKNDKEKILENLIKEAVNTNSYDEGFKANLLDRISDRAEDINESKGQRRLSRIFPKVAFAGLLTLIVVVFISLNGPTEVYNYIANLLNDSNTQDSNTDNNQDSNSTNNNYATTIDQNQFANVSLDMINPVLFSDSAHDCFELCNS
jgi:hypothetical protein